MQSFGKLGLSIPSFFAIYIYDISILELFGWGVLNNLSSLNFMCVYIYIFPIRIEKSTAFNIVLIKCSEDSFLHFSLCGRIQLGFNLSNQKCTGALSI